MQTDQALYRHILEQVDQYYTDKIQEFGSTPRGVDWNSSGSQQLRFSQLLKILDGEMPFSINDYGCGYAALFPFLQKQGQDFSYYGLDVSPVMIEAARMLYASYPNFSAAVADAAEQKADYSIASGIFNVKLNIETAVWRDYILTVLNSMNEQCSKGLAFNCLSAYSDPEFMREDLYYADPCFFFDYCKRNFSRHVSLLHDYDLYEFTLLIRKE